MRYSFFVKETRTDSPADDLVDAALRAYGRHFGSSEPRASLPDSIMSRIAARGAAVAHTLREQSAFFTAAASDAELTSQLARAVNRAEFIAILARFAESRGFSCCEADIASLLAHCEAANDGELNDEQLDAVAAAAQNEFQLLWSLWKNKT